MKILLIRFSSLGDVVLTTPLVRALRAAYPAATLHFATGPAYAPLLESSPRLDRVLTLPGRDAASLRALARTLRAEHYDHVLDLHGTLRARALRLLVPGPRWSTYSKATLRRRALVRFGRRRFGGDARPVAERYFGAARALAVCPDGAPPEVFVSAEAAARAAAALGSAGVGEDEPMIALAPGARHATKCWPEERWIGTARRVVERGVRPVLVGGPEDAALAGRIAAAAPGAASVAGTLDVLASAAVVERARALVSGDTGLMHLASAVGTPLLALFGPTVREFGFFPYTERAIVLERELPCRPCATHGGASCPLGHHACLRGIGVEEVVGALPSLTPLAAGRPPA